MNDTRFELQLPRRRREQLADLADEAGISASDLARLAIMKLLANPGALGLRQAAEHTSARTP